MSDSMSLEALLSELSHEEAPPEFDWSAPDGGSFAPTILPGTYEFIASLRPDAGVQGFDKMEYQGHKYLTAVFDFDVLVPGKDPTKVTYQRVNTFKHEKVAISSMGELLRSLGLHTQLPDRPTDADIVRILQANSGRARGRGEAAWKYFCKTHELTISTAPRKRKGVKDTAWPKNGDGKLESTVVCPKCAAMNPAASKSYGQVEFIRYFMPAKAEAASV
jgi:hypothetical protein